jgi:hypothetical protein
MAKCHKLCFRKDLKKWVSTSAVSFQTIVRDGIRIQEKRARFATFLPVTPRDPDILLCNTVVKEYHLKGIKGCPFGFIGMAKLLECSFLPLLD